MMMNIKKMQWIGSFLNNIYIFLNFVNQRMCKENFTPYSLSHTSWISMDDIMIYKY